MSRILSRAGAALAACLIFGTAPAQSQVVASLAAALPSATSVSLRPDPGCWACLGSVMGMYCAGGQVPGYWNCTYTILGCTPTSPGCGAGAALPVDLDGATQYVSRGTAAGVSQALAEAGDPVRRNCDGVVVARYQTPAQIAGVRTQTESLSL